MDYLLNSSMEVLDEDYQRKTRTSWCLWLPLRNAKSVTVLFLIIMYSQEICKIITFATAKRRCLKTVSWNPSDSR